MGFVGIEEIFLQVKDLDKAIDFYHRKMGIPLDKHDAERAYLQCDRGHLVLQIENSSGRHQAGGPLHFAFTVTEDTFDQVVDTFVGSEFQTRGPIERQEPFNPDYSSTPFARAIDPKKEDGRLRLVSEQPIFPL